MGEKIRGEREEEEVRRKGRGCKRKDEEKEGEKRRMKR